MHKVLLEGCCVCSCNFKKRKDHPKKKVTTCHMMVTHSKFGPFIKHLPSVGIESWVRLPSIFGAGSCLKCILWTVRASSLHRFCMTATSEGGLSTRRFATFHAPGGPPYTCSWFANSTVSETTWLQMHPQTAHWLDTRFSLQGSGVTSLPMTFGTAEKVGL